MGDFIPVADMFDWAIPTYYEVARKFQRPGETLELTCEDLVQNPYDRDEIFYCDALEQVKALSNIVYPPDYRRTPRQGFLEAETPVWVKNARNDESIEFPKPWIARFELVDPCSNGMRVFYLDRTNPWELYEVVPLKAGEKNVSDGISLSFKVVTQRFERPSDFGEHNSFLKLGAELRCHGEGEAPLLSSWWELVDMAYDTLIDYQSQQAIQFAAMDSPEHQALRQINGLMRFLDKTMAVGTPKLPADVSAAAFELNQE